MKAPILSALIVLSAPCISSADVLPPLADTQEGSAGCFILTDGTKYPCRDFKSIGPPFRRDAGPGPQSCFKRLQGKDGRIFDVETCEEYCLRQEHPDALMFSTCTYF